MGNQSIPRVLAVGVVGSEDGQTLCLDGDLQVVFTNDHLVGTEGVRAKELGEFIEHASLVAEVVAGICHQLRGHPGHYGRGLARQLDLLKLADIDGGQVGGHGLLGDKPPAAARSAHVHRSVGKPWCDDLVGSVGDHCELVERLDLGIVIAGVPRRRAHRLRCHECAVFEFLPANFAPLRAHRTWRARVSDNQPQRLVGSQLAVKGDAQLASRMAPALYID